VTFVGVHLLGSVRRPEAVQYPHVENFYLRTCYRCSDRPPAGTVTPNRNRPSREFGIPGHVKSECPVAIALEYALVAKPARNRKIALTAGTRSVGHLLSHCSCGVGPARALRHSRQATRVARASTCSSIAMAQFSIFPADRCALRTCLDRSTAIACAGTPTYSMRSNQKVANHRRTGQPGKGDQGTLKVATSQVCNFQAPQKSRCRPALIRPHLHVVAGRSRFFNNIITPL
jgi:hypothetical protein